MACYVMRKGINPCTILFLDARELRMGLPEQPAPVISATLRTSGPFPTDFCL